MYLNIVFPYSLILQNVYIFFYEIFVWNFISHMPNVTCLAH